MSLTPTLKTLLSRRGPNAIASPPLSRILPVLRQTYKDAKEKHADDGWLAVAVSLLYQIMLTEPELNAVYDGYRGISRLLSQYRTRKQTATFLTANSPACMSHVYRFVSRQNYDGSETNALLPLSERVARAAIMREVGLKCAVFVGVPRVSMHLFVKLDRV